MQTTEKSNKQFVEPVKMFTPCLSESDIVAYVLQSLSKLLRKIVSLESKAIYSYPIRQPKYVLKTKMRQDKLQEE